MKPTSIAFVAAVVAVVLLAGCAQEGGGTSAGGQPPTEPTPSPLRSPGPTEPTLVPTPTTKPQPQQGQPVPPQTTLVGTVKAGVEPGCMLLAADSGGDWLLLGGDRTLLKAGARIEVRGYQPRDILTTCQQGRPFQVVSAKTV
jgi:hypothetical protein